MSENKNSKVIKRKSLAWAISLPCIAVVAGGGAAIGMSYTKFFNNNFGFKITITEESSSDFSINKSACFLSLNYDGFISYSLKSATQVIKTLSITVGENPLHGHDDYIFDANQITIFGSALTDKNISISVQVEESA